MSNTKPSVKKEPSMALNFFFGGLSGCIATLVIQPIDMVKVRIQLASESGKAVNPIQVTKEVYNSNGLKGFYKGLDSAMVRQLFYATTRLGIFYSLMDFFKKQSANISVLKRCFASMFGGGLAAIVATPADLILVRMQSDGVLPPDQRRNYKNFFDAFVRVVKEEGVGNLFRGMGPSVARAVIINFSLLVPFEEFKDRLKKVIPDVKTRTMTSSLLASFVGSLISLPSDNIKTKLQKMKQDPVTGKYPYDGIIDAIMKTTKKEGPTRLWVGFWTYYARIGPHVNITLLLNDYFRAKFNN